MTPPLDCKGVAARVSGYLDGELQPAACDAIEEHCRQCPACAALVGGLREVIGLCREAGSVPLPDAVRQRARERARQLLARTR